MCEIEVNVHGLASKSRRGARMVAVRIVFHLLLLLFLIIHSSSSMKSRNNKIVNNEKTNKYRNIIPTQEPRTKGIEYIS